jgi:hypothetical protein
MAKAAPAEKVSQKEASRLSHKENPKIGHHASHQHFYPKTDQVPLDKATAHELGRFVSEFLSACCSRNSDRAPRQFFAGQANYLGRGKLSRMEIEARMMQFDSFWPKRKYTAKGKPVIAGPFDGDRYSVKQSFAWTLSNGPWESKGVGVLHLRIRSLATRQFEILSMIEKEHLFGYSPRYFGHGF